MVRIYSKAAFQFGIGANRSGDIDCFVTVPNAFQDMPEKYTSDRTFQLAVKCGMVTVIDSKTVEQIKETEADTTSAVDTDPVKMYYEKLKIMDRAATEEEAKKYNVELIKDEKLSLTKKRILEAYKISINEGV